jgi:thiol-disulfide isomerase/thioredoxin
MTNKRKTSPYRGLNGTSTCKDCNKTKPIAEFISCKNKQGYLYYYTCKDCRFAWLNEHRKKPEVKKRLNELARERYQANPEKSAKQARKWRLANPEKHKACYKNWADKNKEHLKAKRIKFYAENKEDQNRKSRERFKKLKETDPERYERFLKKRREEYYKKYKPKVLAYAKEYAKKNKKVILEKYLKKLKTNPQFSMAHKLRGRLNKLVRKEIKTSSVLKLLGCPLPEFLDYFKSKFTRGMSWKKFLAGEIHIDHIRPCASFDLTKELEQRKCFHYSNLQPLWAKDNLSKGAKYNGT